MNEDNFQGLVSQQYKGVDIVGAANRVKAQNQANQGLMQVPEASKNNVKSLFNDMAKAQEAKRQNALIENRLQVEEAQVAGLGNVVAPSSSVVSSAPFDGKYIKTEDHNLGKGLYNSYTKQYGSKATRNFNPGNITGMGGNLLYGAVGMADSPIGDKGDQTQLVFKTPQAGFDAMHKLALSNRYNTAPINTAFSAWQTDQKSFKNKLHDLNKAGINTNNKYANLSPEQQKVFRKVWSQHEGYRGDFY